MLGRVLRNKASPMLKQSIRSFSQSNVGFNDLGDVTKLHVTEEFDQGLTDAQKE